MSLNKQIFFLLNGLAYINPILDIVWVFLADYAIFIFAFILLYSLRKDRRQFSRLLLSVILAVAVVTLLKRLLPWPRPFLEEKVRLLIAHVPDPTFPSKHSAVAFAIAFGVFLSRRRLGVLLLVLASLVALARVITGVHYPLDAAVGAVIGLIAAFIVNKISSLKTNEGRIGSPT